MMVLERQVTLEKAAQLHRNSTLLTLLNSIETTERSQVFTVNDTEEVQREVDSIFV